MTTRLGLHLCCILALFITLAVTSSAQLSTIWQSQIGGTEIDDFRAMAQLANGDIVASANGDNGVEFFRYDFEDGTLLDRVTIPKVVTGAPLVALNEGRLLIGIDLPDTYDQSSTYGEYDLAQGFNWIIELDGRHQHLNPMSEGRYVSGGTVASQQSTRHRVMKLNADGTTIWSVPMGSLGEIGVEAIETSTEAIASVGTDDSGNIHVYFLYANGNLYLHTEITDYAGWSPVVDGIIQEADGNLMLHGSFPVNDDLTHTFIRISPDGDVLAHLGDWPNPVVLMPHGGYLSYEAEGDGGVLMKCYDICYQHMHWLDQYTVPGSLNDPGPDCSRMLISQSQELILAGSYYTGPDEEQEAYIIKFNRIPNDLVVSAKTPRPGVVIEPPGVLHWYGQLINTLDNDTFTDVWVMACTPSGYPTEPIRMWEDVTIPACETITRMLHRFAPVGVHAGEWVYILRTGEYPNASQQACFTFTIHDASHSDGQSNSPACVAWPEANVSSRTHR